MLYLRVITLILALALPHLTASTPAGRPAFVKRHYTNFTISIPTIPTTGAILVPRGTGTGIGTGAVLVARGTGTIGTGAYLDARVTGKPAYVKRHFTNTTTTSTSAVGTGTGAVLVARGTGTAPFSVPSGIGTGTPYL